MPTTVRLDRATERELGRIARTSGRTKSQVIRDLIHAEVSKTNRQSFYDRASHLFGRAKGLPADLSERTGEKVRAILLAKAAGRAKH